MHEEKSPGIEPQREKRRPPRLLFTGLYGIALLLAGSCILTVLFLSNERDIRYNPTPSYNVLLSIAGSALLLVISFVAYSCDVYPYQRNTIVGKISDIYRRVSSLTKKLIFLFIICVFIIAICTNLNIYRTIYYYKGEPDFYYPIISISGTTKVHANQQFIMVMDVRIAECWFNCLEKIQFLKVITSDRTKKYAAKVRMQQGSFILSHDISGWREEQTIALDSPVQWVWVVVPNFERLGSQEVVFEASIRDQDGKNTSNLEYVTKHIEVVNSLGIPLWVVYGGTTFGSILSVPIWVWIYQETSLRLKERRERRQSQKRKKSKRVH